MQHQEFHLLEATIRSIHAAYLARQISCRELVGLYLDRIRSLDQAGPGINSIITVNEHAIAEAAELDKRLAADGLTGPLHGVPVVVKDQIDTVGMPTTLGSVIFKDYFPDQDATVVTKLKNAGAVILAKTTLGELGGGDTHGSLFGSTRNPYALDRTVGGSSGGSAASVSANLGAVAVGQEGMASMSRPSAWNSVVAMRSSAGLVSRTGSYNGWPSRAGMLGPMARTVEDAARVLDVLMGYDSEDPLTAYGVGHTDPTHPGCVADGLRGVRVGVIRESIGIGSEPASEDFQNVTAVFDRAVGDLKAAGADVVDPVEVPRLVELLGRRAAYGADEAFALWMSRSKNPPFRSMAELKALPEYQDAMRRRSGNRPSSFSTTSFPEHLLARQELMANILQLMASRGLDVLVHKTVEHTASLLSEGTEPPYLNHKGAIHLNTYLQDVPAISVPAGYTPTGLPVGISFLGRPFTDQAIVKYAYAFEQATHYRRPPESTPALVGEP